MATYTRRGRKRPRVRETPPEPLGFYGGPALALPISLLLWIAIFRVAWWLMWG